MARESQLTFSSEEILADVVTCEALVVKGVKCHGGFDANGHYRSPRTRLRVPAIEAWQAQHLATSGAPLFEIPAATRYDVTTHAISSTLAEKLPCICGSDTFTIELSRTSSTVPSITENAMIHLRVEVKSWTSCVD